MIRAPRAHDGIVSQAEIVCPAGMMRRRCAGDAPAERMQKRWTRAERRPSGEVRSLVFLSSKMTALNHEIKGSRRRSLRGFYPLCSMKLQFCREASCMDGKNIGSGLYGRAGVVVRPRRLVIRRASMKKPPLRGFRGAAAFSCGFGYFPSLPIISSRSL